MTMGYTRFSGAITIDPPIPARVLADGIVPVGPYLPWADADIALRCVDLWLPTGGPPGAVVVRRGFDAIVPAAAGPYAGDGIIGHVQRLLSTYGADRTFGGWIDCVGDEPGDVWRLTVVDGRAVVVTPFLVWPDDPAVVERVAAALAEQGWVDQPRRVADVAVAALFRSEVTV